MYSLQFKRLKRPTVKLHLSNGGALICLIVSNIVHTIKAKTGEKFAILISSLNKSGQPKEQPALSSGISFGWVENNDTQSLPWIPCSHPKRREWRILIHKLRGQNELALRLGWYEVNESPSFFSFQGRERERADNPPTHSPCLLHTHPPQPKTPEAFDSTPGEQHVWARSTARLPKPGLGLRDTKYLVDNVE